MHSRVGIPAPEGWEGTGFYQQNNDLFLARTDDGVHWNFNRPLNVTNCLHTDPQEQDTVIAMGDTLRPFCTHDIIFDANDNIHIVFEARGLWERPIFDPDVDQYPVYGATVDASFLFHWSEETGEITRVADGWFSQQIRDENDDLLIWPVPGAWRSNVCNPSLAYDANGDLFCVFNFYPREDYNDYVDPGNAAWNKGRCHGDVAVTVSEDNGETWYYPTMITETRSPLADAGEALSESYPTLAEYVDDTLHIFYLMDTEGGTSAGQNEAGASNTRCPVYYHRLPVEEVARDSIWEEGPEFHVAGWARVRSNQPPAASSFRITSVTPNPFNDRTALEFELDAPLTVRLTAHSLDGRIAQVIYSRPAGAGKHRITWAAGQLPSGVYLLRLAAGGQQRVVKVALVR
jgi:hypothetical protein